MQRRRRDAHVWRRRHRDAHAAAAARFRRRCPLLVLSARKLKYEKYAEKGKPEKLEKAMEKQRAKLQKATDKGKPQEYLMYKAEKIEFTQKMWTLAHLVANMKRAGFLPQC